ncbi:MAG: alpha/beta hydrolase, partial [Campylobacteraceae bacterium]
LMQDTKGALNYLLTRDDVDKNRVIVIGQSLGGNNLIAALTNTPQIDIKAIIIDSTFSSYVDIANEVFFGGKYFLDDTYSAKENIKKLPNVPILFLHGTSDRVINYTHTKKLYELANAPKELILAKEKDHLNAILDEKYQKEILNFSDKALQ